MTDKETVKLFKAMQEGIEQEDVTKEVIIAHRKHYGLTQTQAGELLGSGLPTWQSWEYGTRVMPLAKFELFLIKAEKLAAGGKVKAAKTTKQKK